MTITTTTGLDLASASVGLLIARLVLGLAMAAHGSQKLFGWFGGYGLAGTGGFLESFGFRPGRRFAAAAGLTEAASGILVALGLLGPIGPALLISPMVVAMLTVHRGKGFFTASNGVELPLLYTAGAVTLAFSGFGALSLDALLGLTGLSVPAIAVAAIIVGALGAFAMLALRHPAPAPVEARS